MEKQKNVNPPLTVSSYTLGTEVSFADRVDAAKKAGYKGIGLRAENYVDAKKAGLSDEDMLGILKDRNMKVTEVEYITQWGRQEDRTPAQQEKEKTIYHMAHLFGVGHINCGLMEKLSPEQIAESLRELCERAGELIIGLEFMPYSGVPDVAAAWQAVKNSGKDNAMLILDTWHWARASQKSEYLDHVPPQKIVSIQICDVLEKAYPMETLRNESLHDRLAPGTGFGDTVGFVKAVREHGIEPRVIGVEVISDPIMAKGVDYAAAHTYENAVKVLKATWPEVLA